MTPEQLATLEDKFQLAFPQAYREAICSESSFSDSEELDSDPMSLEETNSLCRKEKPWGFDWQDSFWCIGGDGCGGYRFIDCSQDDAAVYYLDHEEEIKPVDQMDPVPFSEFLNQLKENEEEIIAYCQKVLRRIENRRWWQFWVPKSPPQWIVETIDALV